MFAHGFDGSGTSQSMPEREMRYGLYPSAVVASRNTATIDSTYSGNDQAQRLPVLEDVPPVALEVDERLAALVGQSDRELVPRAARVAVTPRETEREVLLDQPPQMDIAGLRAD